MSQKPGSALNIDALVDGLVRGDSTPFHELFAAEGARAPYMLWSPAPSNLTNSKLRAFANTCLKLADADQPISADHFRPEDFSEHLPWMMVLEVEDDGATFRYSHYGDGIANVRGLSMLGQTSADFGGHIGLYFTAVYRAILRRKEWLLTDHVAPKQVFARKWERLMVPMVDTGGKVCRIVAINVPDNDLRAGLEIIPDPVMVLDADQTVRFANIAARRMFDRSQFPTQDMTLFEYSGIDLDIDQTPTDLVHKHAVYNKICLATRNDLLRDILVTISAARIWDHDFYVITLRPDDRTK